MEETKNLIKIGDYIIIQKQNYKKLHKFNKPNSSITLGRDNVNLNGIEGRLYFSYFKLNSSSNKRNREYTVEYTEETITLKDEIDIKVSGNDNRNILDDGHSQKLSAADIEVLKSDANKASDIVETLIINSNTFHNKTEYSQEKYLKKKEKKYFEYIQILKPTLRLVADIMYKLEPTKIQQLRLDTLSQIITLSNIQSEGVHLLYDSGSNGLLEAALLGAIGEQTEGKLVHMHPGNMSQKQALLALNFREEQLKRCISANVYSALRQFYQGSDTNSNGKDRSQEENPLKRKIEEDPEINRKVAKIESSLASTATFEKSNIISVDLQAKEQNTDVMKINEPTEIKTLPEPKKPKWHFDNIEASELLKNKVDSLVIACKEDPQNIFKELVNYVKPGRPFVIYYPVVEPLQNLFLALKPQCTVSALKLTCTWMRNYQVCLVTSNLHINKKKRIAVFY